MCLSKDGESFLMRYYIHEPHVFHPWQILMFEADIKFGNFCSI